MSLDLSKLVGLKRLSGKQIAQCPACALDGKDASKNHLVIYADGKYGCVVDNTEEHSKIIWKMVGFNSGEDNFVVTEKPMEKIEAEQTWPATKLDALVHDYTYWNKRGISDETIAPFRGGVAVTEGKMTGRFVFPIFKDQNTLVGFTGRRIDGRPDMKWKHLGKTSLWKWGGFEEIKKSQRAILVESIGDALKLMEYGVKDVICIFGVNLSQTVLALLITLNPKSIIISTNRDLEKIRPRTGEKYFVGQEAAERIKITLDTFFNQGIVDIIHPPAHRKDWGDSTKEEIQNTFSHELAKSTAD